METKIDWETIDSESAAGRGWALDAPDLMPAGSHYATDLKSMPVTDRVILRDYTSFRTVEVRNV